MAKSNHKQHDVVIVENKSHNNEVVIETPINEIFKNLISNHTGCDLNTDLEEFFEINSIEDKIKFIKREKEKLRKRIEELDVIENNLIFYQILHIINELSVVSFNEIKDLANINHTEKTKRILNKLLENNIITRARDGNNEVGDTIELKRFINKRQNSFYQISPYYKDQLEKSKDIIKKYVDGNTINEIDQLKDFYSEKRKELVQYKKNIALKNKKEYEKQKSDFEKVDEFLKNHFKIGAVFTHRQLIDDFTFYHKLFSEHRAKKVIEKLIGNGYFKRFYKENFEYLKFIGERKR